jgi:hypothetical protein
MTAVRCLLAGAAFLLMTSFGDSAPGPARAKTAARPAASPRRATVSRCYVRVIRTRTASGAIITRRVRVCR